MKIPFRQILLTAFLFGWGLSAFAATDAKTVSPTPSAGSAQSSAPHAKAETLKITTNAQPAEVALVSGDYHKYQANSWKNRGYSGGVEDFKVRYTSGDDVTVDMDGTGIIGNGNYKGSLAVNKKDVGYLNFDYKQFRKYYDIYGGIYPNFPVMGSNYLSRDLSLDIGHIGVEIGMTQPDLPAVSVYYDHDYKNGAKSMLNWDVVRMGAAGNRKLISPSWEELDETTDTFGIKGEHTIDGYHLTGDQRWEMARWKTRGYEVRLNNGSATSSDYDQTRQDQVQNTDVMTTTVGADKWYQNDKVFVSSAYHFDHLKNRDRQNIQAYTQDGRPDLGTLNKPNGTAHNTQNQNAWVFNLMINPWSWLSSINRFKAELSDRSAESFYPTDTTAPYHDITNIAQTVTDSNIYRFAESFGLRMKAIPRSVLYTDLSFEQSENHLIVNRRGIPVTGAVTASDNQTRDGFIAEPVITWAVGADFQPIHRVNLTSQFRMRDKDMQFDDHTRILGQNGQVFLERLHTTNFGFTQRASANLCSWARASFRYLYDNTDYDTRAVYDNVNAKANMLSNTFIYDVSVYPLSNLSMTGSFSDRHDATKTMAASSPTILIPTFTSNFYTWMFSSAYQPHEKVDLNSSIFYTLANNHNHFETYNPPDQVYYGSDYDEVGLTAGVKWNLRKDFMVEPQYGYNYYMPKEYSAGAGYTAQIFSVKLSLSWG